MTYVCLFCKTGKLISTNCINTIIENEVIDVILKNDDPKIIRTYLLNNEDKFSADYIKLAGLLFNSIDTPKELLIIADYIYKMSVVFDKEIQFYAMILELKKK